MDDYQPATVGCSVNDGPLASLPSSVCYGKDVVRRVEQRKSESTHASLPWIFLAFTCWHVTPGWERGDHTRFWIRRCR